MNNSTEEQAKPEWLKALERQSWEAELIVSGLAIYGAIYLLPCVDAIIEKAALSFSDRIIDSMEFLLMYLIVTSRIILLSFILHFVMRTLWIGVVGLSSVYPDGINLDNKAYTRSFLSKYKEEYPTLTDYSIKLDNICSQIFSILCFIIMAMAAFFVWLGIWVLLVEISANFISPEVRSMLGSGLVVIIYALLFFMYLITAGKWKDRPIGEKYGYKMTQVANKTIMLFFYKPATLLSMTFRTNTTTRGYVIANVAIMLIAMIASMGSLGRMNDITDKEDFFYKNSHNSWATHQNYEDEHTEGAIFRPMIQSNLIKENHLSLYIPKIKREQIYIDSLCGNYVKVDSLERRQNRMLKRDFELDCVQKYYQLSIDDKEVTSSAFVLKKHRLDSRYGYQCFIPLDSVPSGNHVLKIHTHYKNDKGERAVRYIPFYKQ